MAIVLGENRYGKAETRLVRVHRDGETHTLTVPEDCPEMITRSTRFDSSLARPLPLMRG